MKRFALDQISLALLMTAAAGCASLPAPERRHFLDSSSHKDAPPTWVQSSQINWEKDGNVYFKANHTIRGDERINGCFDLARLDSKESVLTEMADEVKGTLDNAQQSISESAELILQKSRSSQFHGRVTGLKFTEQYFERYRIGGAERIDCYLLGEMKDSDYQKLKSEIVNGVLAADPRLKEAVTQKQIDFFRGQPAEGK